MGWIRLNIGGATRGNSMSGCGGILRNDRGEWTCGFSKCMGVCSIFVAEFWRVFKGLKIARESGFHKLELHVDSRLVVSNLEYGNEGQLLGGVC